MLPCRIASGGGKADHWFAFVNAHHMGGVFLLCGERVHDKAVVKEGILQRGIFSRGRASHLIGIVDTGGIARVSSQRPDFHRAVDRRGIYRKGDDNQGREGGDAKTECGGHGFLQKKRFSRWH